MIDGDWKLIVPDAKNEPDGKVELYRPGRRSARGEESRGEQPERVARMRPSSTPGGTRREIGQ